MATSAVLSPDAAVISMNLALAARRIRALRSRRFTFEGPKKLPGELLKRRAVVQSITVRAPWRDSDLSHWEAGAKVIGNALAHLTKAETATVRWQEVVGRLSPVLPSQDVAGSVALAERILASKRPHAWQGGRA